GSGLRRFISLKIKRNLSLAKGIFKIDLLTIRVNYSDTLRHLFTFNSPKSQSTMSQAGKIEQQKILRVFKLINLLQSNIGKPVHKLAELLETDERTIYRYFKLLEALGFEVVKEFSKYKIQLRPGVDQTLHYGTFSQEESQWLRSMIESQGKGNLLHDSIIKK